jgi:hypothetical protein
VDTTVKTENATDPRLKDINCEKNLWTLDSVEGPRANAQSEQIIPGTTQNDYR